MINCLKALWRGHRSRKHHDTSKVISMRCRLREVNRGVKEEDKLCNKTTTALSYLLGLQNYAYILAALKHLGKILFWKFGGWLIHKMMANVIFLSWLKKLPQDFLQSAVNVLLKAEQHTPSSL